MKSRPAPAARGIFITWPFAVLGQVHPDELTIVHDGVSGRVGEAEGETLACPAA